jgi:hypothetical protein
MVAMITNLNIGSGTVTNLAISLVRSSQYISCQGIEGV